MAGHDGLRRTCSRWTSSRWSWSSRTISPIARCSSGLLEREGYRTTTAGDGEAALLAVGEHAPDLILLDIGLPRMDGYEVTRRLRSHDRTLTVPIILLTGRSGLEDVVEGLDAGADDFLSKPFRQPELLARIRSALRLRQALLRMDAAHSAVAALANAVEAKDPSDRAALPAARQPGRPARRPGRARRHRARGGGLRRPAPRRGQDRRPRGDPDQAERRSTPTNGS